MKNVKKIIFIAVFEFFCLLILGMKDLLPIYDKYGGFGFTTSNISMMYDYSNQDYKLLEHERAMIVGILNVDMFKANNIYVDPSVNISINRDVKDSQNSGRIAIYANYYNDESLIKLLNDMNIVTESLDKNYYFSTDSYLQGISVTIVNREEKSIVLSLSARLPLSYNVKEDVAKGENINIANYFYSFSEIKRNEIKEEVIFLIFKIFINFSIINILFIFSCFLFTFFKNKKNYNNIVKRKKIF